MTHWIGNAVSNVRHAIIKYSKSGLVTTKVSALKIVPPIANKIKYIAMDFALNVEFVVQDSFRM